MGPEPWRVKQQTTQCSADPYIVKLFTTLLTKCKCSRHFSYQGCDEVPIPSWTGKKGRTWGQTEPATCCVLRITISLRQSWPKGQVTQQGGMQVWLKASRLFSQANVYITGNVYEEIHCCLFPRTVGHLEMKACNEQTISWDMCFSDFCLRF